MSGTGTRPRRLAFSGIVALNSASFRRRITHLTREEESPMRHPRLTAVVTGMVAGLLLSAAAASALEVGQKAPEFTLPAPGGKQVKLSELTAKGPVVLYTFIQAFTGT